MTETRGLSHGHEAGVNGSGRPRLNTAKLGAGIASTVAAGAALAAVPSAAQAYTWHQYCNNKLAPNVNCWDPYYHHLQKNFGRNNAGASWVCIKEKGITSSPNCSASPLDYDSGYYGQADVWNDKNKYQHSGGNWVHGSVFW
jgi:hypothetical protein